MVPPSRCFPVGAGSPRVIALLGSLDVTGTAEAMAIGGMMSPIESRYAAASLFLLQCAQMY